MPCMAFPVWRLWPGPTEHCDEHGPEWGPFVALLQTDDWVTALRSRQLDLFGDIPAGVLGWERI